MGQEGDVPNHQRRKAPPSLQSTPGAHRCGGLEGGLSPTAFPSSKENPRSVFQKGGMDPAMSKSNASMGKASTTSHTEESVEASVAPPTIPLESDYFDRTMPELRRQWVIPVIIMAVTAVLAVIIPVAVILGGRGNDVPPHELIRHTPAPIPVKANLTLDDLLLIVPNMTLDTLERIVRDPMSPQAQALDWIEADPYDWGAYEDWRKIQRFALMVFFFSMGGTGWDAMAFQRLDWGRHHLHECDWTKNSRPYVLPLCNEDLQVIKIQVPNLSYLKGKVPQEVSLLSHLERLDFTKSDIGDTLDDLFEILVQEDEDLSHFFPSLTQLIMPDTDQHGSIPTHLATLTNLQELDLSSNNNLSGPIPSELGLLTNLTRLDLSVNKLTGTIPVELGELPMLTKFRVDSNRLTEETVPESFCRGDLREWSIMVTDWCESSKECCAP